MATRHVRHTPERLIPTISSHISSDMSAPGAKLAIPAFAHTMSNLPSSATPLSTAAPRASRSRTSASAPTNRRPRAST